MRHSGRAICFSGSQGFPGYDVNLDARKRAQDRAKAEMEAEKAKGANH